MKKGFTLLELLIVIAILAILATVTFVVLNPAQLLAQARDAKRIAELGSTRNAINMYLAAPSSSSTSLQGTYSCATNCFAGLAVTPGANCGGRHVAATTIATTSRAVTGTGWIPVNLGDTSGGSPLAALPVDPVNSSILFYSYACDNTNKVFELDADMESVAYGFGGPKSVEDKDGGTSTTIYEVGTDSGLDL